MKILKSVAEVIKNDVDNSPVRVSIALIGAFVGSFVGLALFSGLACYLAATYYEVNKQ